MILVVGAQACGPEFPLRLTACRGSCLKEVMSPGFLYDVIHLMAPQGTTPLETSPDSTRWDQEQHDPAPGAAEKFAAMRGESTADAAYAMGEGLPAAKRLYTAGAVEFNRVHYFREWDNSTDPPPELPPEEVDKGLTTAISWFERVVALSADEAQDRIVWATYMLARAHSLRNRPGDDELAVQEYEHAIALVQQGQKDPINLADMSLGDLARIKFKQGHFGEAIGVYARQASGCEPNIEALVPKRCTHAIDSLWRIARHFPNDSATLDRVIADPRVQQLLIAFGLAKADTTCPYEGDGDCGALWGALYDLRGPDNKLIVAALGKLEPKNVQWPDQAAALAYSVGELDVATRLIKVSSSPYAEWIRAKIALHSGDTEVAAEAFSRALKGVDAAVDNGDPLPTELRDRLRGEGAVLRLSRGDYIEALFQLSHSAKYHEDALYIADQVLTIDELKPLVDKEQWADAYRDLLARRLARAGRLVEALPYYKPETLEKARVYSAARQQADSGPTSLAQAGGLYQAARLEIQDGMELLGTELCPDFFVYSGSFGDKCQWQLDGNKSRPDAEEKRLTSNMAQPDRRFHYREVGVDHLLMAADRLPRHSDVLSEVLCNGASWLRHHSDNDDLIDVLYQRYVHDGRREPWAKNFGTDCGEPHFAQ